MIAIDLCCWYKALFLVVVLMGVVVLSGFPYSFYVEILKKIYLSKSSQLFSFTGSIIVETITVEPIK